MTGLAPRVRKAFSMPIPILARKLTQRGRALGHRLVTRPTAAWQPNGVSPEALRSIRNNGPARFFVDALERSTLIAVLRAREPGAEAATVRAADMVCAHRFELFGSGPTELGERIDWHSDFKSGLRWDLRHHTAINILDLSRPSDVKVVWELSRCHHWVRLGQAYRFTGNIQYAEECLAQWESWMEDNPVGFGVNWACAMEAAIRAINWLWTFFFIADVPAFNERRQRRFLGALADHGRFICRNLEVGPLPGNHYLTNGVGLFTLGTVLRELRGSRRWFRTGWRIIWEELSRQVTPDGVDYEHAIGYHAYVLQCALFVLSLCRHNALDVPASALERIQRMLEFTLAAIRPDGSFPTIGDKDDGSFMDLGECLARDHRPLLAAGAALFGRPDFKAATSRFGAANLWWLGHEGLAAYEAVQTTAPRLDSRAFPQGGFFVMRGQDRHLVVSGAGPGPASHIHHDLLSFECWADGTSYIVDPGTYTYTGSAAWRNHFRATAAHNTVMVDGQEQTRLLEDPNLFPIAGDPAARFRLNRWESGPDLDHFDGEHTGYARLSQPVIHRRQVWFDRRAGYWTVRDLLTGRETHRMIGFLHLAPMAVAVESEQPWVISVGDQARSLTIAWVPAPALRVAVTDGWISPRYGVMQKAPVIAYEAHSPLPIEVCFVLVPHRRGEPGKVETALRSAMALR